MKTRYLLDTSAFRALPSRILQEHTFYASPYCFWELLTHLDERSFDRHKGQLMKFKYAHILNDPRAEIEVPLLIDDNQLQDRVSDEELIAAALAALQDSNSLDMFYSSYVEDSKGNLHQVSECAANVRKALGEAEQKHTEFVENIMNVFRTGQVKLETNSDYHQAILQLLEGEMIKLQQRGAVDKDLRNKLTNNSYIYYSYVFHRALAYFRKGKTKLDVNDFEDSQVCLHLRLDTSYCLVTADKGLKQALAKTSALLNQLNELDTHTDLRVLDVKGFLAVGYV
jgi:hypothetical protein